MKVLICGGAKTKNIVVGLEKKFGNNGVEFIVVNDINKIEEIYGKGEYFDRALICEQGITSDGLYRDNEERVRENVCSFAVSSSLRSNSGTNYVFLTTDVELAEIIHEELLPLRKESVVVIQMPPYSIGFFASLIANDLDKIDESIIFKPITEGEIEELDIFDSSVGQSKEAKMKNNEYSFAEDTESLEDLALADIEDNDSSSLDLVGDEYKEIQDKRVTKLDKVEEEADEEELEVIEDEEELEEVLEEDEEENDITSDTDAGEVPEYKETSREIEMPVQFEKIDFEEELEVCEDDEEIEVELDDSVAEIIRHPDENEELEEDDSSIGELADYSSSEEELEIEEEELEEDEDELELEEEEEAGEIADYSDTEDGFSDEELETLDESLELEEEFDSTFEEEEDTFEEDTFEEEVEEDTFEEEVFEESDIELEEENLEEDEEYEVEVEEDFEEESGTSITEKKGTSKMDNGAMLAGNIMDKSKLVGGGFPNVDDANFKKTLDVFAKRGTMLLVTGTHGAGATVTAYNLGNTLSRLGYKTLVIDCDSEVKSMSYMSKEVYENVEVTASCLREAINGNNISDFVTIVRPRFHVLTDGIASDTFEFSREVHKDRLTSFGVKLKQNYNFILFAMSSKLATDFCGEITYMCDDIIYVVDASQYGITKTILDLCNIDDDAMQRQMFQKANLLYNKLSTLNYLYGYKVKGIKGIAECMDKYLVDLVGDAADELKFSKMNVLGYVPDIDENMSKGMFNGKCWSDTEAGRLTCIGIIKGILFRK